MTWLLVLKVEESLKKYADKAVTGDTIKNKDITQVFRRTF
jgi:hypothetical protein